MLELESEEEKCWEGLYWDPKTRFFEVDRDGYLRVQTFCGTVLEPKRRPACYQNPLPRGLAELTEAIEAWDTARYHQQNWMEVDCP